MSTGPGLDSLIDQTISVITNDGRNIVAPRFIGEAKGVQQEVFGLCRTRGDNVSVVGELDGELDSALDSSNLKAHPLKPVIH